MNILPNAFIVGAPKSATTALSFYLNAHPRISSLPKEVHRFGSDLEIRHPGGSMSHEAYLANAKDLGKDADVVVDASVFYLSSTKAAREIHAFNPEARIIIMLRKPADQILSSYLQMRSSLDESIDEFEEALKAEPRRQQGHDIPESTIVVDGLYYRKVASYCEQVSRYLEVFPKEQIRIILFDDLKNDVESVYRDVCGFLGVEPQADQSFERINPATAVRSRWLVDLQRRVLFRFNIYRLLRTSLPKSIRAPLWRLWQSMMYREPDKTQDYAETTAALTHEFVPEVERLERLIGRDLSDWKA